MTDFQLQHRVLEHMLPVCGEVGLNIAQAKKVSKAVLELLLDELPRAAQAVLSSPIENAQPGGGDIAIVQSARTVEAGAAMIGAKIDVL